MFVSRITCSSIFCLSDMMCDFCKKCSTSRNDYLSHVSFVLSFIQDGAGFFHGQYPPKMHSSPSLLKNGGWNRHLPSMGWLNLAAANCQLQEVYGYAWEVGVKTTGCLLSTMALLPGPDIPSIARKQGFLPNGWVLHANFPPFSAKLWITAGIHCTLMIEVFLLENV